MGHKILLISKEFAARILDIVLPRTKMVRLLESMDAGAFARAVRIAQDNIPHTLSLFDYREPLVKSAVWEIKFRGNQKITALATRLLYDHLMGELGERVLFGGGGVVMLIPVPLAQKRLRERGFNQAERIARGMCALDGGKNFSLSTAVVRTRETESQTRTKSRAERLKNLRGAFAVTNPALVAGKHTVVLDDVATTGATIGEIRKVLLEAGAASVVGLTFAH